MLSVLNILESCPKAVGFNSIRALFAAASNRIGVATDSRKKISEPEYHIENSQNLIMGSSCDAADDGQNRKGWKHTITR